jgi:hypothetical protein
MAERALFSLHLDVAAGVIQAVMFWAPCNNVILTDQTNLEGRRLLKWSGLAGAEETFQPRQRLTQKRWLSFC